MTIRPEIIDAMLEAGCTREQIAAVVKADALAEAEKVAGRREKDRIRQRNNRAKSNIASDTSRGHRVTPRDTADPPTPPSCSLKESPPKGGPKKGPPSTPGTLDLLETKLREAAGNIDGWGLTGCLSLAPIPRLLADGVDLDLDVLPTVSTLCDAARKKGQRIGNWHYFEPAIKDAWRDRVEGRRAAPTPKKRTSKPISEWTAEDWKRRLELSRATGVWYEVSGPPPFTPGCLCPPELLDQERDSSYTVEKPTLGAG